mgnify:CR=1 FL=1
MSDDDRTYLVVVDAEYLQALTSAALALNELVKNDAHRAQPIVLDGYTFAPETFERWAATAMAGFGKPEGRSAYLDNLLRDALDVSIPDAVQISVAIEKHWDATELSAEYDKRDRLKVTTNETGPIVRFFRSNFRDDLSVESLCLDDLLDTNGPDHQDSTVIWVEEMLRSGTYDDSDPGSGCVCIYNVANYKMLADEYAAWVNEFPEIALEAGANHAFLNPAVKESQ